MHGSPPPTPAAGVELAAHTVMSTPQAVLNIRETSAGLRVSVERMLRRCDLIRIEIGHATRILRPDIEAYIDAHRQGAA